jgi:3-methylfumaryl-CoA hydratase
MTADMPLASALAIEYLRSWIGREDIGLDVISQDLVRRFAAMLDLSAAPSQIGDVAPLLIHYCLAQPAALTSQLGEDGHPQKGGFLPPVPLPRRMWAGSSLIFHDSLRVGDLVRRVSRIADVSVKEGRTGTLCFVTVQHRIDVDGALRIEETQNIVYREAAVAADPAKPAKAGDTAPAGIDQRPIAVSTPLLFRYSALTYNGHRIHYDRPYAMDVEFYPGLVVHGPLQATLLINFARHLRGETPKTFSFRGQSPLFDHDSITMHASSEENAASTGNAMKLWTARQDGPVGMSAEASWT